jgi:hypothetical protein
MENLTRNNYEIWFLDYLDGQLNNEQLETLLDFLEQNTVLKQELIGVSGISLAAGAESLDQKELLLKSADDIPGIASADQLCIARMENDLTEEEAKQFDLRMDEDTELSRNYAAFLHTRLNPADSVVYPFKNELRRKTVIFSPWLIAAISSAAIILLAWFLWPDNRETVTPPLAKSETLKTEILNQVPETRQTTSVSPQLASNISNSKSGTGNPKPENRSPKTISPAEQKAGNAESIQREFVPMNSVAHKTTIAGPRIPDPQNVKILFASNYSPSEANPLNTQEAITLPQYALQLFRERILGEDRILVRKTRFSMWEVAGAGVSKINDLAGTKMKLNREYDSKGDIMAVSFNSRLFDIESPTKSQGTR